MIIEAKANYETNLAFSYAHTNSNKIFQYISSIKGRENFPANMTYNDDCVSSDSDKAQLFNNYFYSIFSTSDDVPTMKQIISPDLPLYKTLISLILMSLNCSQPWMSVKHVILTASVQKILSIVPYHYFK